MKKIVLVFGCLVFGLCFAPVAMAGTAVGSGIDLSAHDLAAGNPAPSPDPLTRICIYCHTPHHAYKLSTANGGFPALGTGDVAPDAYNYLPLWNHTLTLNSVFYPYQNGPGAPQNPLAPKASQAIANGMTVGSSSLLCLSCHDGSVAVNSYGTSTMAGTGSYARGSAFVVGANLIGQGGYLGNHHPIGFDYDSVSGTDLEIRPADVAFLGTAGPVRSHLYGGLTGVAQMECATCHSVHNTGNTGETLLWRSDQNSRLCLTCHIKGTDPGLTP